MQRPESQGELKTTMADKDQTPHVAVLGGGFGGMAVCKRLARERCRVTLIDRRNHHLFQPLLYQVATGGLSGTDIAAPLRGIFRPSKNVRICKETVMGLDLPGRQVRTDHGLIPYDYVVLALGTRTAYFGHDEWAAHTLGLKSLSDAMAIRRGVINAFEEAEVTADPERARELLTVVIVGGGPTGVEMAGAIADLKRHVFRGNFRRIDPRAARVVLVEAKERLLLSYGPEQSEYARKRLEDSGVEVRLNTPVVRISENLVQCGEERLATANIIWVAGVEAPPLTRQLGLETDRAGRLEVLPDLSLPGYPEAFAIGDLAKVVDGAGKLVPGVAPAATQMGNHVACLLREEWRGRPVAVRRPFVYRNKGEMATIGRAAAIADIRGWKSEGILAWFLWLFIHLMYLVGFRNRVVVFVNWVHAYFTYDRGARIVIDEDGDHSVPA